MKVLGEVKATPEQLIILKHAPAGTLVIRGAAGSGKTTTALLRLKFVLDFWAREAERLGKSVRVLVLTYNKTLRGYVAELARQQVKSYPNADIEIKTFASWAVTRLGNPDVVREDYLALKINTLGQGLPLDSAFLVEEANYILGRFPFDELDDYVEAKREGRGKNPQVKTALRKLILSQVVVPYLAWLNVTNSSDWVGLAHALSTNPQQPFYDIVVVDETQDFTANRVRAIMAHLRERNSLTFVLDGAQRIYPDYFTWNEVGIDASPGNVKTLSTNYRNTKEIATFAQPIIAGLELGPDAAIPNPASCERQGEKPWVVAGRFSEQIAFAVDRIRNHIDLDSESVAFLHAKGGRWFSALKEALTTAGIEHVTLSRESEWPSSSVNVALCTMHSAKGLEFDHVFILGLNQEVTEHDGENDDEQLARLRRLMAMAIGRARVSLCVGYKVEDASVLTRYFSPGTFVLVSP